jgi:hypothetical protein
MVGKLQNLGNWRKRLHVLMRKPLKLSLAGHLSLNPSWLLSCRTIDSLLLDLLEESQNFILLIGKF